LSTSRKRPVRLQLARARGFDLQKMSRAANGLEAAVVSRPGVWGNPFRAALLAERKAAVAKFRTYVSKKPELRERARTELKGKNLACWCSLDGPCHADVWLEIANS
jgi:hypothetical protein